MANEVKIVLSAKDLASGKISKLKKGISGVNSTLQKSQRGMLAAGAASVAFGALAVRSAANFDKGMREVNTLINVSNDELDSLGGQVRELSKEFGINAVDATKALYSAISAGQKPAEAIEFLGVAAKTSIGGVTDLETAVDGLTSIVNAFGYESSETQDVADIMFETMRRGKTTIGELSDFFFQAAPVSSALGVTFEELSAAITTLTLSGTPTRVAMTQIRSAMVSLAKPTKEMEGLFEAVGFESGLAAIRSEGLVGALNKLQDESGATEVEFIKAVGSIESLAAVMGLTGKNTPAFLDSMDAMENAAGNVERAYATMADSTSQKFAEMTAAMQDAKIEIGENLAPAMEDAAAAATVASEAIGNAPTGLTNSILGLGFAAGTIGILTASWNQLAKVIIPSISGIKLALGAMTVAGSAMAVGIASAIGVAAAVTYTGMKSIEKTQKDFAIRFNNQFKEMNILDEIISIENAIGAMSFESIRSFHKIAKGIDGFLTDSYLSLDATVKNATENMADYYLSLDATVAEVNEQMMRGDAFRTNNFLKQRGLEKEAIASVVKAEQDAADDKEKIRRDEFDDGVDLLYQKLAKEMEVADLARQANEALEADNKAAFASLFQSVMNLPSVIQSNLNQGRGFGDDMLGLGTGKDIFSQMGANAMGVSGFRSGTAATKSITGQFGFVGATNGLGFGDKNSGMSANGLVDMEERFNTFVRETIALNREMGNMNPIIINGDVYGVDDLVAKIADANTQAAQLGMN